MKWYVTNGVEVKAFDNHLDAMEFVKVHNDWWEVMS